MEEEHTCKVKKKRVVSKKYNKLKGSKRRLCYFTREHFLIQEESEKCVFINLF